jgi:hypothetical protein
VIPQGCFWKGSCLGKESFFFTYNSITVELEVSHLTPYQVHTLLFDVFHVFDQMAPLVVVKIAISAARSLALTSPFVHTETTRTIRTTIDKFGSRTLKLMSQSDWWTEIANTVFHEKLTEYQHVPFVDCGQTSRPLDGRCRFFRGFALLHHTECPLVSQMLGCREEKVSETVYWRGSNKSFTTA